MTDVCEHMSQAAFARYVGVSRAAVSQWKTKGILSDAAFQKPGKAGKIIVAVAVQEARKNRDIGQSSGNGLNTKTHLDVEVDPTGAAKELPLAHSQPPEPEHVAFEAVSDAQSSSQPEAVDGGAIRDTVEDRIKHAKLEAQLRKNRQEAAEEALRAGQLIASVEARTQMARIAVTLMQTFEGALPDFATALAEKFGVPQRDALHLMRAEFNKVRTTAAKKERARAEGLEAGTRVSIDGSG